MKKLLWMILFCPVFMYAQSKEEAHEAFENLIGGTWSIDATWGNGTPFQQEYTYEWGLNKAIINLKTMGIVNMETGERGHRNQGIIAWNSATNKMVLYQFDVFGGIIEVTCSFEKGKIFMEYDYAVQGATYNMCNTLEFVDKNTYNYSVSMKTEDGWQVLLSDKMTRKE